MSKKKAEWYDDPEVQERERRLRVEAGLRRSAIIWTPVFVICAALFLFFLGDILFGDQRVTWFLIVVLAGLSSLFGFQAYQSLSDLRGTTKTTTGRVSRRWARSDSLILKSHYIRLGRLILRGDELVLDRVKAGDLVEVEYYPHSSVILNLKRLPEPGTEETAVTDTPAPA